MKFGVVAASVLAASVLVTACGGTKKVLGLEKSAPDEFRVITKAPLILPPDYSLRPPRPGEARPGDTSAEARAAIFGADIGSDATAAEKLLVTKAGASAVDPGVRTQVDFEGGAQVTKSKDYSDKLMAPSATPSTAEDEQIRRATGGAKPTINTDVKTTKLPGL